MQSIPRRASTVLLMNESSQIYLTKRPLTMKFLGGYYVFPGGAVEETDSVIDFANIQTQQALDKITLSHYIAAARELFEEVGIFLGRKKNGEPLRFSHNAVMEYRKQLINHEISFSSLLKQEDLSLDLDQLAYFGHRITPNPSPIRFDTRFFLAKLPKDQTPSPERYEIADALWIHPKDALTAYNNGKMMMAEPTVESLRTIIQSGVSGQLKMPAQQR